MRALALIAAVAAACFAAAAAAWLLSTLYASAGNGLQAERRGGEAALEAHRIAVRLAPWDGAQRARYGRGLAAAGLPEARDMLAHSLRQAPSDPYLWHDYGHQLLARGVGDPEAGAALRRARELAPHSPTLRRADTRLAVYYWNRADTATRDHWRDTLRETLRLEAGAFLPQVVAQGRQPHLCAYLRQDLEIDTWCDTIDAARPICASEDLRPRQLRFCRRQGLLP